MKSWIDQLIPIIDEYKNGSLDEPLDGDAVDRLCAIIKAKINLQEGNITNEEYETQLDIQPSRKVLIFYGKDLCDYVEKSKKDIAAISDDWTYGQLQDKMLGDMALHNYTLQNLATYKRALSESDTWKYTLMFIQQDGLWVEI